MEILLNKKTIDSMRSFVESMRSFGESTRIVGGDLQRINMRLAKSMRLAAMTRDVSLSCHSRESGNPSSPSSDPVIKAVLAYFEEHGFDAEYSCCRIDDLPLGCLDIKKRNEGNHG